MLRQAFAHLRGSSRELVAISRYIMRLDDGNFNTPVFSTRRVGTRGAVRDRQHPKLKASRDRKKAATGKCEGRRSYAESKPETVALAKELHGQRMALRKIAAELAARGHLTGLQALRFHRTGGHLWGAAAYWVGARPIFWARATD
jgi:hypothetical protein